MPLATSSSSLSFADPGHQPTSQADADGGERPPEANQQHRAHHRGFKVGTGQSRRPAGRDAEDQRHQRRAPAHPGGQSQDGGGEVGPVQGERQHLRRDEE